MLLSQGKHYLGIETDTQKRLGINQSVVGHWYSQRPDKLILLIQIPE
jgi:predicted GIY-YIG superfamily endonuclease